MNKYIKYLKALLYIFIPILFFNIILALFYYFNIINNKTLSILNIILILISMFIGGLYIGKKSNKKGYIEGIKIGILAVLTLFIISYLIYSNKSINTLIYYLVLIFPSILGSILGINKRKTS